MSFPLPEARSRVVTWSPSVTLVPTRACFNACGYCSFRRPLAEPMGGTPPSEQELSDSAALGQLRARPEALGLPGCCGSAPWPWPRGACPTPMPAR
jgi:FO synthase subunit 1